MKRKILTGLLAAAVIATAGGCGGSKDEAKTTETPKAATEAAVTETETPKATISADKAVSADENKGDAKKQTVKKTEKKKKKKTAEATPSEQPEQDAAEEARAQTEAQAKAAEEAAKAAQEAKAAEEARIAEEEAQRLAAEQAAAAQAVTDQDIPQDPAAPSPEETKKIAESYQGRPIDELIAVIGPPTNGETREMSCKGPGYDVVCSYAGFDVYVYEDESGSRVIEAIQ